MHVNTCQDCDIIIAMKDKLVIHTNPHLRDSTARATAACHMVEASSAIEGINVIITPVFKKMVNINLMPSIKQITEDSLHWLINEESFFHIRFPGIP